MRGSPTVSAPVVIQLVTQALTSCHVINHAGELHRAQPSRYCIHIAAPSSRFDRLHVGQCRVRRPGVSQSPPRSRPVRWRHPRPPRSFARAADADMVLTASRETSRRCALDLPPSIMGVGHHIGCHSGLDSLSVKANIVGDGKPSLDGYMQSVLFTSVRGFAAKE